MLGAQSGGDSNFQSDGQGKNVHWGPVSRELKVVREQDKWISGRRGDIEFKVMEAGEDPVCSRNRRSVWPECAREKIVPDEVRGE